LGSITFPGDGAVSAAAAAAGSRDDALIENREATGRGVFAVKDEVDSSLISSAAASSVPAAAVTFSVSGLVLVFVVGVVSAAPVVVGNVRKLPPRRGGETAPASQRRLGVAVPQRAALHLVLSKTFMVGYLPFCRSPLLTTGSGVGSVVPPSLLVWLVRWLIMLGRSFARSTKDLRSGMPFRLTS